MPENNEPGLPHLSANLSTNSQIPTGQEMNLPPITSYNLVSNVSLSSGKKLLLISVFFILTLVLIGSGYFYLDTKSKQKAEAAKADEIAAQRQFTDVKPNNEQQNQQILPPPQLDFLPKTSPRPSPNKISGNVYSNPTLGISFNIPSGWIQDTDIEESTLFNSPETPDNTETQLRSSFSFGIQSTLETNNLDTYAQSANGSRASQFQNYTVISSVKEKLGGQDAYIDDYTISIEGFIVRQRQVYTLRDNKAYIFTFTSSPNNWEKDLGVYDSIRNSFSFSGIVSGVRSGF